MLHYRNKISKTQLFWNLPTFRPAFSDFKLIIEFKSFFLPCKEIEKQPTHYLKEIDIYNAPLKVAQRNFISFPSESREDQFRGRAPSPGLIPAVHVISNYITFLHRRNLKQSAFGDVYASRVSIIARAPSTLSEPLLLLHRFHPEHVIWILKTRTNFCCRLELFPLAKGQLVS